VRFLIDAQLPPALARYLGALGHEADHVIDIGLEAARDKLIWNFAAANSATIVTKDGDFAAMRAVRDEGPSVIWVRIGNTTAASLLAALARVWPGVIAALEAGEGVVEVR
jgi:predicted nuclease of predicted toxin-antitoxin system